MAGVQYAVVPGTGVFTAAEVEAARGRDVPHPGNRPRLDREHAQLRRRSLAYPLEQIRAISERCRRHSVPLHLDGARVWNAAAALGVPVAGIARSVDSLSSCLSKGLGAPVGSLLCGSSKLREEALRLRKMLGGGMRQAGVLAAAGLYALEHHVARLPEDHARARRLAESIAGNPGIEVHPERVQTNIVLARLHDRGSESFVAGCARRGLLLLTRDARTVRFVTHLDVEDGEIDEAAEIVGQGSAPRPRTSWVRPVGVRRIFLALFPGEISNR